MEKSAKDTKWGFMPDGAKITTSDLIGKVNATFTIIAARPDENSEPNAEIVLGYRRLSGLGTTQYTGITVEYVTWVYFPKGSGFIWGHYHMSFETAIKDFMVRGN